jgi:hypothetical protein
LRAGTRTNRITMAVVEHAGQTTCANCHNPNYWQPAEGLNAFIRESVCR